MTLGTTRPAAPVADNLERISARIRAAAEKSGRNPSEIKLLAVSKSQPAALIAETIKAGLTSFGENYLQEASEKMNSIGNADIEWHFIGTVQSNKTRYIAASFAWVHSVDRESIARRLSRQHPPGSPSLNVCIQVNLDEEKTKSGVSPTDVEQLLELTTGLPGIRVRGLMYIPPPTGDIARQHRTFAQAKSIFDRYSHTYHLDTLSMGMSDDFEVAIEEGATMVRLGTAIFGRRPPKDKLQST